MTISHQRFWAALAFNGLPSAERDTLLAGLLTMRLVETWARGEAACDADELAVRSVRDAIAKLPDDAWAPWLFESMIDVMVAGPPASGIRRVAVKLLAYGEGLLHDAEWGVGLLVAPDVFETIARVLPFEVDPALSLDAMLRLASALRANGDLDTSARMHEEVRRAATDLGFAGRAICARIGLAVTAMHRGNLPAAEDALRALLPEAAVVNEGEFLPAVQHDLATVLVRRERFDEAAQLLYAASRGYRTTWQRERALADLADVLYDVGLCDLSKRLNELLSVRAKEATIRHIALINRMDAAINEGEETVFERCRRTLEETPLPVTFRGWFYLAAGDGCMAFGRESTAERYYREALALADAHGLNELSIKAERAVNGHRTRAVRRRVASPPSPAALGLDGFEDALTAAEREGRYSVV